MWAREVVASAGGRILGVCDGVEPQHGDSFIVSLDGWRFCMGAISRHNMRRRMGAWFGMGEFGAGMRPAGKVAGAALFGVRRGGHWEWDAGGYSVEVYAHPSNPHRVIPLSRLASLVAASKETP